MDLKNLRLPGLNPSLIFNLRDCSFASDLFIAAVGHLDFFNRLDNNPMDLNSICRYFKIQARPADVMLTLFKSYGFIFEKDGLFSVSKLAQEYLSSGSFWDLSPYIGSLKDRPICLLMYEVFKTGKPAAWAGKKEGGEWKKEMEKDDFAGAFTAGMNSRGAYLARGIARKFNMKGFKKLLDIGGASGIYSIVFASVFGNLSALVFDKPPVDKIAGNCIKKFELEGRVKTAGGDFFKDEIPEGYDLHFLSHVLHDWDKEQAQNLIVKSYKSLEKGGSIAIHDAHANRNKTGPVSVAEYSALLMFTTEGKCYSIGEMEVMLKLAGFRNIRHIHTILNRSIIVGRK
ncbi:MAG: methyltransferase [Brevinematales bacterium]|jgi:predicted O-methyltransferase YrrM